MPRAPVANLWQGILLALLLMAGFFLLPILCAPGLSLTAPDGAGPTLANSRSLLAERTLTETLLRSLILALPVVGIATLLAWYLAFCVTTGRRALLRLILIAPFWTSFIIRACSSQKVLSESGVIAAAEGWLRRIGLAGYGDWRPAALWGAAPAGGAGARGDPRTGCAAA